MSAAAASRAGGFRARWTSMRARLLAGGFALVFCVWSVDTLGHDHGPKKAMASHTAPATGAFVIADPADRAALDRFLAADELPPPPLVFDVERDPFSTPTNWAVVAALPLRTNEGPATDVPSVSAPSSAPTTKPERPFSDVHHLQGVILGARPLALIDGNGYRIGDWIDGYRVVALSRDLVELRGSGGKLVLRVAAPNLKPARNSP
jgi:hypothetical protein